MSSTSTQTTLVQSSEINEATIDEINKLFEKICQIHEESGIIDEEIKIQYYAKLKVLPNAEEIIQEFEKLIEKLTKEENEQESLKSVNTSEDKPLRIKRQSAPLNPQYETEKKQTCIELFADFGAFFNKSISKIGLKYCSESEIVRRSDILTNFNAATNQLKSGQQ
ncbi:hypothetical protein PVAND_016712 [Polypedilum vanderplanki]|uniref:Uncharacterized protein n=1 Tax=Polypedilum vanderplanki TaxID=319348 RepID=A0A9J6BGF6_POLVA|nr:hypothetical protein PVAND_016712 [Polypedilum vanderplanki]